MVSSGTNIKIRPFRILTCVYPGVPAGYKYSIDSPGGFNSMTAVTRKHIPGFVCALALFAAAAANADTGADKSTESLVCTTMTNALNFAFTMQQGTAVQMECRLDSFRKLDDQHMKEWLVKAEERNKKCIEDQTRAVRMARALGYDFNQEGLSFADLHQKMVGMLISPDEFEKISADSEPDSEYIDSEYRDIREAYDTVVHLSGKGKNSRPLNGCTIVTSKNTYFCSNGNIVCK